MAVEILEKDLTDLSFCHLLRLKVGDNLGGETNNPRNSLITVSNKFGYIFAAHGNRLVVIDHKQLDEQIREDNNIKRRAQHITDIGQFKYLANFQLDSPVLHISLNSTEEAILLVRKTDSFIFADVLATKSLIESNLTTQTTIKLTDNPSQNFSTICWNPSLDFKFIFAVISTEGVLTIYEVLEANSFRIVASLKDSKTKFGAQFTCGFWSPKGKQICVGDDVGCMHLLTHDLTSKGSIPKCPQITAGCKVLDILWETAHSFFIAYKCKGQQPFLVHAFVQKGQVTHTVYEDVCYGSEEQDVACYNMILIRPWDMILVASSSSVEMCVLLKNQTSKWVKGNIDEGRPEIPLTSDFGTNLPICISLYTNSSAVYMKGTMEHPPSLILIVMASDGTLVFNYVLNTSRPSLNTSPTPKITNPFLVVAGSASSASISSGSVGVGSSSGGVGFSIGNLLSNKGDDNTAGNTTVSSSSNSGFNFGASSVSSGFNFGGTSSAGADFTFGGGVATPSFPVHSTPKPSFAEGFFKNSNLAPVSQATSITTTSQQPTSSIFQQSNVATTQPQQSVFSFNQPQQQQSSSLQQQLQQKKDLQQQNVIQQAGSVDSLKQQEIKQQLLKRQEEHQQKIQQQQKPTLATTTPKQQSTQQLQSTQQQPLQLFKTQQKQQQPTQQPQHLETQQESTTTQHLDSNNLDPYLKSIIDEVTHFEKELKAIKSKPSISLSDSFNQSEKSKMVMRTNKIQAEYQLLKNELMIIKSDSDESKTVLIELEGMIEKIKWMNEREKNIHFLSLLKKRPLGKSQVSKMAALEVSVARVVSHMTTCEDSIGRDYQLYQGVLSKQKSTQLPQLQMIYDTLKANLSTINRLKKTLSAINNKQPSNQCLLNTSLEHCQHLLSNCQLNSKLGQVSISTSGGQDQFRKKEAHLAKLLGRRKVVPIKSTVPKNLDNSLLMSTSKMRQMTKSLESSQQIQQQSTISSQQQSTISSQQQSTISSQQQSTLSQQQKSTPSQQQQSTLFQAQQTPSPQQQQQPKLDESIEEKLQQMQLQIQRQQQQIQRFEQQLNDQEKHRVKTEAKQLQPIKQQQQNIQQLKTQSTVGSFVFAATTTATTAAAAITKHNAFAAVPSTPKAPLTLKVSSDSKQGNNQDTKTTTTTTATTTTSSSLFSFGSNTSLNNTSFSFGAKNTFAFPTKPSETTTTTSSGGVFAFNTSDSNLFKANITSSISSTTTTAKTTTVATTTIKPSESTTTTTVTTTTTAAKPPTTSTQGFNLSLDAFNISTKENAEGADGGSTTTTSTTNVSGGGFFDFTATKGAFDFSNKPSSGFTFGSTTTASTPTTTAVVAATTITTSAFGAAKTQDQQATSSTKTTAFASGVPSTTTTSDIFATTKTTTTTQGGLFSSNLFGKATPTTSFSTQQSFFPTSTTTTQSSNAFSTPKQNNIFGAPTTQNIFGSPTQQQKTSATSQGNVFGSPINIFGTKQENIFSTTTNANTPPNNNQMFFGQSSNKVTPGSSVFGAKTTANQNVFSSSASSSPFGGVFGQASTTTATNIFGNNTNVFGGSTPQQNPFSKPSSSFSSGSGVAVSGFGGFAVANKQPVFGAQNTFGSPRSSGGGSVGGTFGGAPVFGGTQVAFGGGAVFGGMAASGGNMTSKLFGAGDSAPSNASGGFASFANNNTPSFGDLAQSGFGSSFGGASSGFGGAQPQQGFGSFQSSFSSFGQSSSTFGSSLQSAQFTQFRS